MKLLGGLFAYIAALVIFVGVAVLALVWVAEHSFRSGGPLAKPLVFEIARNTTLKDAVDDLHDAGAITSPGFFMLGMRLANNEKHIQSGSFMLPAGSSMQDIMDILVDPEEGGPRYRVTARIRSDGGTVIVKDRHGTRLSLPESDTHSLGEEPSELYLLAGESGEYASYFVSVIEGLTSWQIVNSLVKVPFLVGTVEEVPPEGSLAPDTYHVIARTRPASLIERMQSVQDRILAEEWAKRYADLPFETPGEALIIASIIEKESGLASERELISSVFANRLRIGMRLQSDPTVIYGLTEGRERLGRKLRRSDLRTKSPFNTYMNGGLPPTPIANPGRLAIRAAMNPAISDYLFFVADGSGGHKFSVNFDEHLAHVAAWRRLNQ